MMNTKQIDLTNFLKILYIFFQVIDHIRNYFIKKTLRVYPLFTNLYLLQEFCILGTIKEF